MQSVNLNSRALGVLALLRVLVGWHFLYEGAVKWYNPDWSAFGYLQSSQGPLSGLFQMLAQDPWLDPVNLANKAVLTLAGISLILGIWERVGALMAAGLLLLYYLAHPPFPGLEQIAVEGNYWLVNKNLIELVVVLFLYLVPTGAFFGLPALRGASTQKSVSHGME